MTVYLAPLIAAAVTFFMTGWMLRSGVRVALDLPNERSLHDRPIPRSGGLAIMAGALFGFALGGTPPAIFLPAAALAAVSLADDMLGLPVLARFAAHFAAAALFAWLSGLGMAWMPMAVAVVAMVWMTNLYNFMDGSDGLAAGMAVIGFSCLGVASLGQSDALAATGFVAAAAALAFLAFNFPPARIFMGDAGSIPLGYLAAAIGLAGIREGLWPPWFPVVVFSPFIVDASLTLARRMLRGERFWRPHKTHYYQRLVQMGWGHRGTALAEYALMALCAGGALWALGQPLYLQLSGAAILAALYAVLAVWIDFAWRNHTKNTKNIEPV